MIRLQEGYMRRTLVLLSVVAVLVTAACQQRQSIWYKGDFGAATAAAEERDTLVMVEFYADWCSWCQRMEKDTFSETEVRQQLQDLVPLKLDAEREGERLADRYAVDSYPTYVFVDPDGEEIDRIEGYLPPEEFLAEAQRIRTGDTFVACLHKLTEDPSDMDALIRAVVGLLERSDPDGAISRITAFHRANSDHNHGLCKQLMFKARAVLQSRLYGRAAKLYRKGWDSGFEVPDTDGTLHLHALLAEGLGGLETEAQAVRLRQARFADAADLLEMVSLDRVPTEELWDIGDFANQNGHYDLSAAAYEQWFATNGNASDASRLNNAAWQLYLSGRSLDTALEMARQAFDETFGETPSSGNISDTVARLLYVTGDVDAAIPLQRRAVRLTEGARKGIFHNVLKLMEASQELGDQPNFESYPGDPFPQLTTASGTMM
jgi:thioredoxin-related protein